jgi:hypothetical protein
MGTVYFSDETMGHLRDGVAQLGRIADTLERLADILDDATAQQQSAGQGWRASDPFRGLVPPKR